MTAGWCPFTLAARGRKGEGAREVFGSLAGRRHVGHEPEAQAKAFACASGLYPGGRFWERAIKDADDMERELLGFTLFPFLEQNNLKNKLSMTVGYGSNPNLTLGKSPSL
jgi:hypothetical protein